LADLWANLIRFGLADRVNVIDEWSTASGVKNRLERALCGQQIGLLVIDSDGEAARDFEAFRGLLAPRAFIVCDDYVTDASAQVKADKVKPWIDGMVAAGEFETIAVEPWGTWFGRYLGRQPLSALCRDGHAAGRQ
jgi:hypothetical protein